MIFREAVLRLTIAYTVAQLVLYGAFAVAVYLFVTSTFDFDITESEGALAIGAAERGFATLRTGLLVSYAALAVVVPFLSYMMAHAALRPLRTSYEAQQRFVDDASHEFRSPLSTLQGELELALSLRRSREEYEHVLRRSLDDVQALISLTENLLLLARGSSEDMRATFEEVSLGEIAMAAAARRNASGASGANVTVTVLEDARVMGSPELLTRAAENVLDNAARYTPQSGAITISIDARANRGIVRIEDSGSGMGPEAVRHAFDRFWRADDARALTGHGLGLALVRQICVAHGGEASISSVPGHGTTITLSLPLI
jgi:signal transduction histidine kinase